MSTMDVVFDGKSFVPTGAVNLPTGTKTTVAIPDHGYPGPPAGAPDPNRVFTPEEEAVWIEFMNEVRSSPPWPPTFEEYLRYQRGGA